MHVALGLARPATSGRAGGRTLHPLHGAAHSHPECSVWRTRRLLRPRGAASDALQPRGGAPRRGWSRRQDAAESVVTTRFPIATLIHPGRTQLGCDATRHANNVLPHPGSTRRRHCASSPSRTHQRMYQRRTAMGPPLVRPFPSFPPPGADYDTASLFVIATARRSLSPRPRRFWRFPRTGWASSTPPARPRREDGDRITVVARQHSLRAGRRHRRFDAGGLELELNRAAPHRASCSCAPRGNIPRGYLNDPVKTAATFVTTQEGAVRDPGDGRDP